MEIDSIVATDQLLSSEATLMVTDVGHRPVAHSITAETGATLFFSEMVELHPQGEDVMDAAENSSDASESTVSAIDDLECEWPDDDVSDPECTWSSDSESGEIPSPPEWTSEMEPLCAPYERPSSSEPND